MIEEGLWTPTPRKLRHRQRRERRAAAGELVQMDTSVHPWLENRSAEPIVLVSTLDDATSRLFARFVPRDTGAARPFTGSESAGSTRYREAPRAANPKTIALSQLPTTSPNPELITHGETIDASSALPTSETFLMASTL